MQKRVLWFVVAAAVAVPISAQPDSTPSATAADASVSVPREVLERYVGRYELNGTIATISLTEDGQLMSQLTGQPATTPLRAVSTSEFAIDSIGARLFFEGDGPKATRIRSRFAGNEVVGTRLAEGAVVAPVVRGPGPAPTFLDAAARKEVVAALGSALRQRYVFPDVGERAASRIDAALAAGEYDSLSDPAALAARLGADVSAIAHDKHLRINAMGGPPPSPPPGATGLPMGEAGVVRADRLTGGVGYIEVIGFPPQEAFKPVIDRAMTALKGSKALIIDIRRNGGGDPGAVSYLSSFLVPPGNPTHLNDIVMRVANTTDFKRSEILSSPTPVDFSGLPVYVLTSAMTFSGGEGFAYEVQALKLGKVIGEVTGGGANPTGGVPLPDGLMAMIPFGRAENPVTKTNWEGRGVQPDVMVPAADAFKTALQRLGQPPVAEVAAASQQRVFAPRAIPLAGTEAAARLLVTGLGRGTPDYASMTPEFAEVTRQQLPQLQRTVASLGEIKSLKFVGPAQGGDAYDVTFAKGALTVAVMLGPDGKLAGGMVRPGAPQP